MAERGLRIDGNSEQGRVSEGCEQEKTQENARFQNCPSILRPIYVVVVAGKYLRLFESSYFSADHYSLKFTDPHFTLWHFMFQHSAARRKNRLIRQILAYAVVCFAVLSGVPVATAQEKSAESGTATSGLTVTRLRLGLGGLGRVGRWMPIQLEASGLPGGSTVQAVVVASDARGDQCADNVATVDSDDSGQLTVSSVFMTGRLDGNITVRLVGEDDKVLWEHVVRCQMVPDTRKNLDFSIPDAAARIDPVQSTLKLIRHDPLSLTTVGVPEAVASLANEFAAAESTKNALTVMSVDSLADLPTSSRGLDCADFLYLVDGYELSETQRLAVEEWVTAGGHLIVSCGTNLPQLLQSSVGNWLQPIFQIEPTLMFSQDLSGLQNFVSGSSQLQTYRKAVPLLKLRSAQAWSVVDSINGPLMQRVSYGAGQITILAVNLNEKPVNQWLSLPQLYEMLIFGRQLDTSETSASRSGRISSSGVSDLATQIAAVSDAVPAAERWSTWNVMLLIVAFLIVIGPIDYLLVVRLLQKPHLTWLTFPLLIAGTCYLAWSWVGTRDAPLIVRQMELLDIAQPASKQTIRTRSWSSISAADSGHISVTARPLPFATTIDQNVMKQARTTVSWHGRAENVYGGLYREGGVALGRQLSRRSDQQNENGSGFSSIPLLTDGSSAFLAETFADVSNSVAVKSNLQVPPSGLLEGGFTHHLSSPIENWIVVFGNRVYHPAPKADAGEYRIEPGKPWSRNNPSVLVSDLREFLKGVRVPERTGELPSVAKPNHTQIKSFYDTQGTNLLDMLMMVSLYEIPGGETFVKLQNNALRHDEVSSVIHLNTVLVLGTLRDPLSEMIINGTAVPPTASQTVVRLLLPVARVQGEEDSKMADPVASNARESMETMSSRPVLPEEKSVQLN
jgi:hypothetical protein